MKKYTFNNKEYYLADDVYKTEPESFVGCSKTSRLIIKNKKLKPEEYIYKKYIKSKNEWLDSDDTYKSSKVFIVAEWVHNNLIKFKAEKTEEDLKIEAMKAPPIIELNDDEKFVDINGNKLDIEVRGSKEMNNIYFKVKDISIKFDLGDVSNTLLKSESSFKKDIHYKLFKILKVDNIQAVPNKNTKYLFLTFKGLTKLLYVSYSKNAEHFQDWANNILFTHQLGSKEQKEDLCNKLLGVPSKYIKDTLKIHSNNISCIYLYTLGTVKDLRNTFNIADNYDDSSIVCKFGKSNNLLRRNDEHDNDYGKMDNVNLRLKVYSYIDEKYITQAENDIKNLIKFNDIKFDYENRSELIIISADKMDVIKNEFDKIRKIYAGDYKDIINAIEKQKSTIELLETKINSYQKEIEFIKQIHLKDVENKDFKIKVYEQLLQMHNIKIF